MREKEPKRLVLVVGGHKGTGHMKAAGNLGLAFRQADPQVEIKVLDIFDFLSPFDVFILNTVRPFFSYYLRFAYRHIHTFVMSSRYIVPFTRAKYGYAIKGLEKHIPKDAKVEFVATYPMAAVIGAALKAKYDLNLFVVPTDFLLQRLYFLPEADGLYMPQDFTSIVGKIGPEFNGRIHRTGIPINFRPSPKKKGQAKLRLGLKENRLTALVSMGGNVFGGMRYMEIFEKLLGADLPMQVLFVAGVDKELKKEVAKRVRQKGKSGEIKVFGYVTDMEELYDAADVFVGKAGGLSITEAVSKGLPMCLFDALPGQEDHNCDFVLRNRLGIMAKDPRQMVKWLSSLADKEELERWQGRVRDLAQPESATIIAEDILCHRYRDVKKLALAAVKR